MSLSFFAESALWLSKSFLVFAGYVAGIIVQYPFHVRMTSLLRTGLIFPAFDYVKICLDQ